MLEVLGSIPGAGDDTFVDSLNNYLGALGVVRYNTIDLTKFLFATNIVFSCFSRICCITVSTLCVNSSTYELY